MAVMYDCSEWQRLLWLNPCVGKLLRADRNTDYLIETEHTGNFLLKRDPLRQYTKEYKVTNDVDQKQKFSGQQPAYY